MHLLYMTIIYNMNLQKSLIYCFLAFLVCNVAITHAQSDARNDQIAYQGYRIELVDLIQKDKSDLKGGFTATIINSGKFPVTLGKSGEKYDNLQVLIDDSSVFEKYPDLKSALIKSVLSTKLALSPGQLFKNINFQPNLPNIKMQDTYQEPVVENQAEVNVKAKKQDKKNKKSQPKTEKPENIENQKLESVKETSSVENEEIFDSKNCPDLIISNASIIKSSKNNLKIECTILNQGTKSAPMHEYKKTTNEDISLAAYFSASSKMSRGSVLAGGHVITSGLEKSSGNLLPGESMTVRFSVSLEDKSRYLNSLIISVDSRQLIYECVENNNNFSIQLK